MNPPTKGLVMFEPLNSKTGRPKTSRDSLQVNVKFTKEENDVILDAMEVLGVSKSDLIRLALAEYLKT